MAEELTTWKWVYRCLHEQIPVALLFVVQSVDSTPGKVGAKMAVALDGRTVGTVGGGIAEHRSIAKARRKLREQRFAPVFRCEILREDALCSGMICGGQQTILLYSCTSRDLVPVELIIEALENKVHGLLSLSPSGLSFTVGESSASEFRQVSADNWRYQQTLGLYPTAYLIGGGHVSLALSKILATLDFSIVVLDERAELDTLRDNTYAQDKIIIPFTDVHEHIPDGQDHYAIIMTPSHQSDEKVLMQLLEKRLRYLGMLGSKTKVKAIMERLRQRFPEERLRHVHAPAGLSIHSHTPAEIAISITAELIKVKNAGP